MLIRVMLVVVLSLLFATFASAQGGHIQLLTVAEQDGQEVGGLADLYLEIRPGSGQIFIDTVPLTQIDTQISARFANEMACEIVQADCAQYDYFYTIRAASAIVSGPSAGAAITALTALVLDGLPINTDTVLTGTINSGGVIGPVAGIPQKVQAAQDGGYARVLIPAVEYIGENESNQTMPNVSLHVTKVSTIYEALAYLSGQTYGGDAKIPVPEPEYLVIMEDVADRLCNRTQELDKTVFQNESVRNFTQNRLEHAQNASLRNDSYSRASFCFTANLRLRRAALERLSQRALADLYGQTEIAIGKYNERIEAQPLRSLSELETYMIVKERLIEAVDVLKDFSGANITPGDMAYALERYYSGVVWGSFFSLSGPPLVMDETHLRQTCIQKLSEAEARLNYLSMYIPIAEFGVHRSLSYAREDLAHNRSALCIFKASKTKAEANAVISGLGIPPDQINTLVEAKLAAVRKMLARQQDDIHPILGYSYYEYSKSLLASEPYTALTFAEYALELGDLSTYFPRATTPQAVRLVDTDVLIAFGVGVLAGVLGMLGAMFSLVRSRKKQPQKPQ